MSNPENKEFPVPFDEAGNMIITKPEKAPKSETIKKESDELVNGKTSFSCQYCDKEWDKKRSKSQHERWCTKNPKKRSYYKKAESVKKPKEKKQKTKEPEIEVGNGVEVNILAPLPKIIEEIIDKAKDFTPKLKGLSTTLTKKPKTPKGIDIIKELRNFDKIFGLTDEQIVKYIRDKIEEKSCR